MKVSCAAKLAALLADSVMSCLEPNLLQTKMIYNNQRLF